MNFSKEIFDPLEMNTTKFYLTDDDRSRFQPLWIPNGSLKGYTNDLDELTYNDSNRAYFGDEGLKSTMLDFSNFCKMLVNQGNFNGIQIISKESINEMTDSYSKTDGDAFDYGYSLFVLKDSELDC